MPIVPHEWPDTPVLGVPLPPEITLRDWFAGQALAHLVSGDGPQLDSWEKVAAAAYDAADVMLEKREK